MIYTGPSFGMLSGGGVPNPPTSSPMFFSASGNTQTLPIDTAKEMRFENPSLNDGIIYLDPTFSTIIIPSQPVKKIFMVRWWCNYRKFVDDSNIKFSTWLEKNGSPLYSGCNVILKQQTESLHGWNHFESHVLIGCEADTETNLRIWWYTGTPGDLTPPPINGEIPSIPVTIGSVAKYVSITQIF